MSTQTIEVPHLGGIKVGYKLPSYDASKPTCVLVNSMCTSSDLYRTQFASPELTATMNLLAIEPLGHGATVSASEHFTYWDSAIMNLQVLDALGIKGKVFALGTSQGGWIVVRMALLQPARIAGVIPLGTSMDYESERTRKLGNIDVWATLGGPIQEFTSTKPTPDFVIPEKLRLFSIYTGFGKAIDQETADWWHEELKRNYSGDAGRKRLREVTVNIRDRDGLHGRLSEVQCPVLWLHGTNDPAYLVPNAEEEIKLFVKSPDARLQVVEGGEHYLSSSHPKVVNKALIGFVQKHSSTR